MGLTFHGSIWCRTYMTDNLVINHCHAEMWRWSHRNTFSMIGHLLWQLNSHRWTHNQSIRGNCCVIISVGLNQLSNKRLSSFGWFETPWGLCGVTIVTSSGLRPTCPTKYAQGLSLDLFILVTSSLDSWCICPWCPGLIHWHGYSSTSKVTPTDMGKCTGT